MCGIFAFEWQVMFDTNVTQSAVHSTGSLTLFEGAVRQKCSRLQGADAHDCVHVSVNEWMDCGLPPLVGWPASGDLCWRRPVGPTSARCWREARGGKAFCLPSAPLIFHLIGASHPLHLPPPIHTTPPPRPHTTTPTPSPIYGPI